MRDSALEMRDNAISVNNAAGSDMVPAADPMEEHAEAEPTTLSAGVESHLAPCAESPDPLMYGAPRDDPLTLSQQSPRKVGLHGDGDPEGETGDGVGPHTQHGPRAGAVSPMRPAAKRPLSVAAAAPIKQSKKGRVALGDADADCPPRVPSAARARGRGGARAVYAPSQGLRGVPLEFLAMEDSFIHFGYLIEERAPGRIVERSRRRHTPDRVRKIHSRNGGTKCRPLRECWSEEFFSFLVQRV
ncbi:hypothetical protein B0H14DRAFT_2615479 [Mycena olivaceomarginata]|nr:hypothetical protein B0H14DRAFT_2615479 [Mycena olivaceomarginata]